MRPTVLAAAALASLGIAMAGCAALEGLSSISEQACAPDCDGGASADGTTVTPGEDGASPGVDVTTSDDTTLPDDTTTPPVSDDSPAGQDAPASDDGSDSSVADAGEDTGPPPPVDSGADTGCGPLDTTTNCSACLSTCIATNATSPSCNGTTCSYTCKANSLDCNAASAPDLDGCECTAAGAATTDCCAGSCPIAHHYDLDLVATSLYYACIPVGTYNVTLATDACLAFVGDAGASQCNPTYYCTSPVDGGVVGHMACSDGAGASACDCWGFDGELLGLMSTGTGKGQANCVCPQQPTPSWN